MVLFDEFDAIAKDRDNAQEHGELKRVVNTLLQMMDAFKGSSVMIAATNHEAMLDSAVWRRFELVLSFGLPTAQERVLLLRLFLHGMSSDNEIDKTARALHGLSGADLEQVAVDAARRAVLAGHASVLASDLKDAVASFTRRVAAINMALAPTESASQV